MNREQEDFHIAYKRVRLWRLKVAYMRLFLITSELGTGKRQ
jgi:hypothetical protein